MRSYLLCLPGSGQGVGDAGHYWSWSHLCISGVKHWFEVLTFSRPVVLSRNVLLNIPCLDIVNIILIIYFVQYYTIYLE